MLSAALLLFANTLLFSLRLSGGGSFPKPLTASEERESLHRCASGDTEARNVLIERNLRLVAHIVKKYYTQNADQEDLISIGTIGLGSCKADNDISALREVFFFQRFFCFIDIGLFQLNCPFLLDTPQINQGISILTWLFGLFSRQDQAATNTRKVLQFHPFSPFVTVNK